MREGSPRPARSSFPAASVPREDHVTAPTDPDVGLRLPYLSVGLPRSRSVCAFCQEATLRPGLLTSKPRTVQGRHRKGLRCCSFSRTGPLPRVAAVRGAGRVRFPKSCLRRCQCDAVFPLQAGCLRNGLRESGGPS